jgi:carboxymethylenebutenolidase
VGIEDDEDDVAVAVAAVAVDPPPAPAWPTVRLDRAPQPVTTRRIPEPIRRRLEVRMEQERVPLTDGAVTPFPSGARPAPRRSRRRNPGDFGSRTMQNSLMNKVEIETPDGSCRSYVYRPTGSGPWPGVLVFMDGVGIRPAMLEVAERLATHGYFVLLPDLFYRSGPYEPMDARTVFSDPEQRQVLMAKFIGPTTPAKIMADTRVFLDYLAAQPDVKPGGVGTTGYCMGGLMSLTAAGTYPARIVAAASYHGGRLATDAPDSPHLLAPKMKARVYVAGAIEDASFPDDMKARLEEALTSAGVDHVIETYPARHGWVLRDTPVYDAAAAERHWKTLLALFEATLGR